MKRHFWHLIGVRPTAVILVVVAFAWSFAAPAVFAQPADLPGGSSGNPFASSKHHTQAKLLFSVDSAKPGDTILAGVEMKMEPGWHTYWKNGGDAGSPTKIVWTLPAGVTAGEIQWPVPKKIPPLEVTTYGYEDEVVLIVPLTLAANVAPGELNLSAKVSWLECKDICIPAGQDVSAKLTVGGETKESVDAKTIQDWKYKLPRTDLPMSFHAWWDGPATGDTRPMIISGSQTAADSLVIESADFFPDASDNFEVQAATEKFAGPEQIGLRKMVKKFSGDWPKTVSGVIVTEGNRQRYGFPLHVEIGDKPEVWRSDQPKPAATALPAQSLWQMMLYAFIGGLILNIMPCVLPVIALKILGFVSEARSEPRRVRVLGLVYTLGVVVSFMTLAGIIIGVKAAGHQAGWGMQFGSPVFVVCLTTLVLLVALNLFGVFEVTLGGRVLDTASELCSKSGPAGVFFNGVLATTLATPCTAPFLAPALGFAFQQSAQVIVLVFLMVGLGLSSPYVILSWHPGWLKFLPKPGAWMEKFKNAMGFPMLATVVWLFSVAASDYGSRVLWLGIFLVIVAFAAWIYGEFFQRGRQSAIALLIALALLAGGYAWALESRLHWREMVTDANTGAKPSGKIEWQPWSTQAVAAARAAGKPVLVDFTATWCVTCNAIVKPALENDAVVAKLKELNTATLLADDTLTPADINAELNKFGAAGVPLVLVYPKDAAAQPIVMPQPSPLQLPSSYSKLVLEALERAK